MSIQRRVGWSVVGAVVVDGCLAFFAICLFFSARMRLTPKGFALHSPRPSLDQTLAFYWYWYVAIAVGWVAVAFLTRHLIRPLPADPHPWHEGLPSPKKFVFVAQFFGIVGTFSGFAIWLHGYRQGWF